MIYRTNILEGAETPREAIFQALGAVSVCWDHPEKAGVFQSDRAKMIGDELIERLSELFDLGYGWDWE